MGLLSTIFGESGAVAGGFTNLWYLVGFFILIFFILYLYSRRSGAENIVVFVFLFLVLSIEYTLFDFPISFIIIISFVLLFYTAQYMYYWFNK